MSIAIWKKLRGSSGPEGMWGHTCNAIRGRNLVYIFGGCRKQKYTNYVDIFDTGKMLWSEPLIDSTPPVARVHHSCTTVRDKLFVFGGMDGTMPLDDLHILDTSTNTWILPCVKGDVPHPREGHSASIIGKRLFIFGGCAKFVSGEIYYDDLYTLETETFTWNLVKTSGTPPSKRSGHTSSAWKNKIVVIGGEDANDYFSDVHILDTDTLVWSKLDTSGQAFPPRRGHTTVSCGESLFVFGGFSGGMNMFNDLHKLDIGTSAWMKVIPLGEGPSRRFSLAGERLDPQGRLALIFIGGCNNVEAIDDIYLLLIEKASLGFKAQTSKAPEKGIEKIRDRGSSTKSVLGFGTSDLPTDMEIDFLFDVDQIVDMDIAYVSPASAEDMITCYDFADDPFFNQAEFSWLYPTNYIYPVRDQGQLEVCWAFVSTGNLFSVELINHSNEKLGSVHELVERVHYFYPASPVTKVTSVGLRNTMVNAYKYVQRNGIYTEEFLPLQPKCLSTFDALKGEVMPWIPLRFQREPCEKIVLADFEEIKDSSEYDKIEDALRKQPIGGAIMLSLSFARLKPDMIWEGPAGVEGSLEYALDVGPFGGEKHALEIVSFGGAKGKDGFYTVKNSWGSKFCKDGFANIRRHTLINDSISYPLKTNTCFIGPHDRAIPWKP